MTTTGGHSSQPLRSPPDRSSSLRRNVGSSLWAASAVGLGNGQAGELAHGVPFPFASLLWRTLRRPPSRRLVEIRSGRAAIGENLVSTPQVLPNNTPNRSQRISTIASCREVVIYQSLEPRMLTPR